MAEPELSRDVASAMSTALPQVAENVIAAITAQVPSYADPFKGTMGRNIQNAVQFALGGFIELASGADRLDTRLVEAARTGAYALGRGEARSGRSMESLLAAYRVGARVAWREMSLAALNGGLDPYQLSAMAELVFAYIDELSAISAAGHADELATTGLVRQRYLDRLAQAILSGASADVLTDAAERADWAPPGTLTAVLIPESRVRGALALLDRRTLRPVEDVAGSELRDTAVLLVPDADGTARGALLRTVRETGAAVGPPRPWQDGRSSYVRALRARRLQPSGDLDTEAMLVDLVLGADAESLADLRARALAPLEELRPAAAEKLRETLRSWLLHHGRRDQIAAELFIHPQTVRYRVGQLRELFGEGLEDPQTVLELTIALGSRSDAVGG
jgi:hypothetical protein